MGLRNPSDALSDVQSRARRREHLDAERQTRRVKISMPISGDPRHYRGKTAPPSGLGVIPAIVTTAITACTGTTPGTGAVQLYYMDGPDAGAASADGDNTSVPTLNWYTSSGTIAIGTHVTVAFWSQFAWLVGSDC